MEDETVIYGYSLDEAIAGGVLVEVFKPRWQQLSGGKPIIATSNLFNQVSLAGLFEIWNEFVMWRKQPKVSHQDEYDDDETFVTKMNGQDIWVIEDGQSFTMLLPEDY